MRKLSCLLVGVLLVGMMNAYAFSERNAYSESPILTKQVQAGDLPPVEERLPDEPKIAHEILPEYLDAQIGNYGGTLQNATMTVNWDAVAFVGMNEALLSMTSENSDEIIGNILKSYEVNEDSTEFVFHLREGLCWSDGEPVTMEDIEFTYDDFIKNTELNPVISANMRSGGKASGTPMSFEKLDDWSFKITFDSSYGGFLVYLSIKGWAGYTDMLKPAHYLKQFHIDYAEECHGSLDAYYEFITPYAEALGYDDPKAEGVWTYVFNQIDMTNWELTDPTDAMTTSEFPFFEGGNFPVLYGWMMESSGNNITTWVRNPYYFKVDAAGQQLPYIDHIESTYVETDEMITIVALAGGVDCAQMAIQKYTIFAENENNGNYRVQVGAYHNTPTNILINATYGLKTDGTVKDDPNCQAWQEVVGDVRFREALTCAIDAEELIDTLYFNFASLNTRYDCTHNIDKANALLDEMGMADIDGDGFRETPSGQKLQWQVWNQNDYPDLVPASELYVEFWSEIGLNVSVYTTDSSLLAASRDANEIPMRVCLVHEAQLWHYLDWGFSNWDVLWNAWVNAGGMSGEIPEAEKGNYLEPPQEYIELRQMVENLMSKSPEEAVNTVLPQIADTVAAEMYVILPITKVGRLVITAPDLGNVPTGGLAHSWNSLYEMLYFADFTYED